MRQSTSGSPISPPDAPPGLRRQVDLTPLNSFGCQATAAEFLRLTTDEPQTLASASRWLARSSNALVLGGGTNLLMATATLPAVLQMAIAGRQVLDENRAGQHIIVRACAGENWHDFVLWTLQSGCYGLENLALIPGTVGAAPVQNIGAYGVELTDLIQTVEAFDRVSSKPVILSRQDCGFAYRDSIFKQMPERWLITAVQFALRRSPNLMLDYGDIRAELLERKISRPAALDVAHAVMAIRRRKLPDPAQLGNAGSFFKNAIVPAGQARQLSEQWPGMPVFDAGDGQKKIAAGWLIEQCGFKGFRDGDAGVHADHALVLVNYGQASGQQILDLAGRIIAQVQAMFGISLEPEPRIIRNV